MDLHEFAMKIQEMSDEELQEHLVELRARRRMTPERRAPRKPKQQDAVSTIVTTDGSDI
jgi:hypothetical protein